MENNPIPASTPKKEVRYAAIGIRLAVVEVDFKAGKVRIRRIVGRKERLRIWADGDLVRPQQYLVGRRHD